MGPATVYPILLGNNAGGFPHLFLGTARPLLLRIIRVHGRVDWGVLSQSSFSPVTGETYYESVERPGTRRFMGGAVVVLQPVFLPGLEVGAARFIHEGWPAGGLTSRHFGVPFQTLYKKDLVQDFTDSLIASGQNQLLSVFARWAVYQAAIEFYAERGKDDHNWDRRDLIVETEHSASTTFGFAKVWPGAGNLTALRAEVINYASPANAELRHEPGFYPHGVVRQGHTHRGQLLGASIGAGSGAGARVSLERYNSAGKYSVSIAREQLDRRVDALDTTVESQVKTMLQLETIRFTRLGNITAKVGLTNAIHWNFGDDRTNWSFMLGTRVGLR
ncbi:MAG TPA: capsule assembly Wzi family protein [Gemmatimonadaceae bacterium]|nr:capsule assembly Wzi family protein [Gemmatimonadaceae bacterium]